MARTKWPWGGVWVGRWQCDWLSSGHTCLSEFWLTTLHLPSFLSIFIGWLYLGGYRPSWSTYIHTDSLVCQGKNPWDQYIWIGHLWLRLFSWKVDWWFGFRQFWWQWDRGNLTCLRRRWSGCDVGLLFVGAHLQQCWGMLFFYLTVCREHGWNSLCLLPPSVGQYPTIKLGTRNL